ncbi:MAG: hypothetical protein JNK67_02560 [Alphaproteobacteria bacterium]|nr:hypothetical protein [Alphaproteobacteria bacterium]
MEDNSLLAMTEQFAARICHDLVGPVGAIANGVELLADDGGRADPEVVSLIATSARTASRRLQYYRAAFGSGNAISTAKPLADARALAISIMEDGKVALDWGAPAAACEAMAGRDTVKIMLNLLLVALESLPRGGTVRLSVAPTGDGLDVAFSAEGQQARIPDDARKVLEGAAASNELTPRAVPARLARLVAESAGAALAVSESDGAVRLTARIPRAA